jgi:hypothetical protein
LGVDVSAVATTTDLQRGIEDAEWLLRRIAAHEPVDRVASRDGIE